MIQSVNEKLCDLCDGAVFERVADLDRKGQPLPTVVCKRCGLIAHEHVPSDHELEAFYQSQYREDYHGETRPSERRIMRAWRNGRRIYRQLADYVVEGDEVFEVGAGIGCTVKQFERHGCHASGIEPHAGFQSYAAETLGARVSQASLFNLPPRPCHDVVLLVHVIEHFRSPRAALTHLHQIIRPGGLLYVECPNVGAPFAMRDKLFHFAHIHNFTPRTLEMMAERTGFVLERSFRGPGEPSLEMVFRKARSCQVDYRGSYEETLAALERHNWASYHLRWNYLWPRLRKLAGYASEHLVAKPYVNRVLRSHETAPAEAPRRAA